MFQPKSSIYCFFSRPTRLSDFFSFDFGETAFFSFAAHLRAYIFLSTFEVILFGRKQLIAPLEFASLSELREATGQSHSNALLIFNP